MQISVPHWQQRIEKCMLTGGGLLEHVTETQARRVFIVFCSMFSLKLKTSFQSRCHLLPELRVSVYLQQPRAASASLQPS